MRKLPSTTRRDLLRMSAMAAFAGILGGAAASEARAAENMQPFPPGERDEVILEERWAGGEWFRSGSVWRLGKGRVFYFRPGHETYPVFKQEAVLRILSNAVRWLATT
jgi:trehalose utilization protein